MTWLRKMCIRDSLRTTITENTFIERERKKRETRQKQKEIDHHTIILLQALGPCPNVPASYGRDHTLERISLHLKTCNHKLLSQKNR